MMHPAAETVGVSEIGSRLGGRPGIPSCGPTAVMFLMCLLFNGMGRGLRMKADAAKQLSVDVVYLVEASEEQKRSLCVFWRVVYY